MFRIRPGQTVYVDGAPFRMHVLTTDKVYVLENQATRAPVTLSNDEMSSRMANGTLTLDPPPALDAGFDPVEADFLSLPQEVKDETNRRHRYVKALTALGVPKTKERLKQAVLQLAAEFQDRGPPSPTTAMRWLVLWEKSGGRDIRALVPRIHRRGNRTRRVDSDILNLIEVVIDEYYYRREKTTVSAVHELVCGKLKLHNDSRPPAEWLPYPSLATIRSAISARSPYEIMTARKGKHAANLAFIPAKPAPKSNRPLEIIEIDHTVLDIMLIDEETGAVIGRPTMTTAIDKFSRMIVGFYVGFEPAGTHSVMLCLRHSILNKLYVREKYPDIQNDWPCQGLPTTIMVDNGPEFHSEGFRSSCAQLGINITYAPGKAPWYKSAIERFFGSLNTSLLHQIPGTTFSRPTLRGDYKSDRSANLTLADLHQVIHIWLLDHYGKREPRLRGRSPIEEWNKGVADHGLTPLRSIRDLDCLVGGYEKRKLTRAGVSIFDLVYSGEQIFDLLNRKSPPKMVEVRYDHGDLSYILVQDPLTRAYIKLLSVDPEYTTGLTLAQHKFSQDFARKRVKGRMTIGDLGAARLRISEAVDQAEKRGLALRRRTAKQIRQLKSTDSETPLSIQASATALPTPSNDEPALADQRTSVDFRVSFETED